MANTNSPGPAVPVLVSSLGPVHLNQKVRIAGRILSYDRDTQIMLMMDEENYACLIDISLCLEAVLSSSNLRESKTIATAIGYLEHSPTELPIPTIPPFIDPPVVDTRLVLRVILLTSTPDLDLVLWRTSIHARENISIIAIDS